MFDATKRVRGCQFAVPPWQELDREDDSGGEVRATMRGSRRGSDGAGLLFGASVYPHVADGHPACLLHGDSLASAISGTKDYPAAAFAPFGSCAEDIRRTANDAEEPVCSHVGIRPSRHCDPRHRCGGAYSNRAEHAGIIQPGGSPARVAGCPPAVDTLERERRSKRDGDQAGAHSQFSRCSQRPWSAIRSWSDRSKTSAVLPPRRALEQRHRRDAARPGVSTQALGFGAGTDVVGKRITLAPLDTARKMLMVGRGRAAMSRRLQASGGVARVFERTRFGWPTAAESDRGRDRENASLYGVDPPSCARSSPSSRRTTSGPDRNPGAIGLMQLMRPRRASAASTLDPRAKHRGRCSLLLSDAERFGGLGSRWWRTTVGRDSPGGARWDRVALRRNLRIRQTRPVASATTYR